MQPSSENIDVLLTKATSGDLRPAFEALGREDDSISHFSTPSLADLQLASGNTGNWPRLRFKAWSVKTKR
jgi:hypothetical protein